ncbi:MAG: MFS transporter [Acetobacteraceae bacterium]|nr:MFS transporter [Acetobacteraceae bacterium]
MDLREAILTQPMRKAQIGIVVICIVLTMIDGYEVVVMPFVVPSLARAWGLSAVEVGYVLSAGIFGMALGAILISPLADQIGRRRHIMVCLAVITLGMLLSAFADNVPLLIAFRAFAGLFIGAIISSVNVLVSEYSSDRRRGTVMGIYGVGLPLGSALAGTVIGPLLSAFDWRAPFIFGAALTLIMLALVMFALPESIEYLIEKRPKGALDRYNRIADRLGYARAAVLPAALASRQMQVVWKSLFSGVTLYRTLCLWLGYAGLIAAFYFANTWTAKMMADASGDPLLGIRTGVLIMVGGVAGALLFAGLSLRMRPRLVTTLVLFGGAITYLLYAHQIHNIGVALALSLFVGMFANGGVAAFYAISPFVYPTVARGTGVGWMIGFGRAVAILAPIFTGYMLRAGWTPQIAYQFFGGVLAVAGIAVTLLDWTYRGRSENPETPEADLAAFAHH